METGSRHVAHLLSVHVACLAFAVTFLATCALGGGLGAALTRGAIATGAALLVGRLLLTTTLEAILSAIARDRAAAEKAAAERSGGDA